MADSVSNVLRLKFTTASDKSKTININNVVDEADLNQEDVTAVITAITTNNDVYADKPVTPTSAELVTTSITEYDVE